MKIWKILRKTINDAKFSAEVPGALKEKQTEALPVDLPLFLAD